MNFDEHDNSRTYKIRTGNSDSAIYFTIVGGVKPVAFFFNSREMGSFPWVIGKMTDMSRLLEAGVPIGAIIKDMEETFDPGGDYIIPDGTGRKVNSVVHHLGLVIGRHMRESIEMGVKNGKAREVAVDESK